DAATAPGWVDIVRPGLTRSQYVEFPFTGHSVLDKHPCAMTIMNAFLADPARPVDAACAGRTTLTFVTG
ncbi:MAG: alpha/beta hydrolase, partial [Pseudonocardia sp.]